MAKFIKEGKTINVTPAAAIAAGDLIIQNGIICLANWAIAADEPGTLQVLKKGDVINVTTAAALGATAAGTALYLTSAGAVTLTAQGNTALGQNIAALGAADVTFDVIITG